MRFKCWEYVASCHDRSTRVISYQLLQCFSWQISFFHWHAISTVDPRYFRFPVYSCRQLSRDMLKSAKDLEIALSLSRPLPLSLSQWMFRCRRLHACWRNGSISSMKGIHCTGAKYAWKATGYFTSGVQRSRQIFQTFQQLWEYY